MQDLVAGGEGCIVVWCTCMCDQITGNFPLLTYNDVIIHSLVPRLFPHAENIFCSGEEPGYKANHTGYLTLLLLYNFLLASSSLFSIFLSY